METAVIWPKGEGPFPAVIMYHHIGGLHESLMVMARRLASYGYCVVAPSLYWRIGEIRIDADNQDPYSMQVRGVIVKSPETPHQVMSDTRHLLDYMHQMRQIDDGPRGAVGYCLGGRFALLAACEYPDEVTTSASMYGTDVGIGGPEDLRDRLRAMRGSTYLAFAETDRHTSLEDVETIREMFAQHCTTDWEVELHAGTRHGFSFPGRPMYDFEAAERTWTKSMSLFRAELG